MLLLTLPGTLTLYYGEEIGMVNVPVPPEEVQDPAEKNEPGIGAGRDPERSPMQWNGTALAGFTTGKPWLPIAASHQQVNVEALDRQPSSILNLYRRLLTLRKQEECLIVGEMVGIAAEKNVLRYGRFTASESLLLLLNLCHEPARSVTPAGTIILSTCLDREGEDVSGEVGLRASEGLLIRLERKGNPNG